MFVITVLLYFVRNTYQTYFCIEKKRKTLHLKIQQLKKTKTNKTVYALKSHFRPPKNPRAQTKSQLGVLDEGLVVVRLLLLLLLGLLAHVGWRHRRHVIVRRVGAVPPELVLVDVLVPGGQPQEDEGGEGDQAREQVVLVGLWRHSCDLNE